MTETTVFAKWALNAGTGPRFAIDAPAFFIALVGAPLYVTAGTFWLFGIPIFALLFGGPVYLALGTPALLIHLRRNEGTVGSVICLSLLTLVFGAVAAGCLALLAGVLPALGFVGYYAFFGAFFAPLWAWAFIRIYNRLRSDLSRMPH